MDKDCEKKREEGVGLALSGGGFRASLYHLGALLRLNELGWFKRLTEVTSVSGGSITAAYLGYRWKCLDFDDHGVATNFAETVADPLCEFCSKTIDIGSVLGGIVAPFVHPWQLVAAKYNKALFHRATLQDLPAKDEGPRFTIYATNLQTGVSVRFARPYMGDYRLGKIDSPTVPLATAVAASSAFPPVFCPVTLDTKPEEWQYWDGADLFDSRALYARMLLGDGGIYDNLGLERIWDRYTTVLVSDAGAPFSTEPKPFGVGCSQIFRTLRSLYIMGEQTRALRKRRLIADFKAGKMGGTYWGIATHIANYKLEENHRPAPLLLDDKLTRSMAAMRTRLNRFSRDEQKQLIDWGYALTDAAMRRHVLDANTEPGKLPSENQPFVKSVVAGQPAQ